MKKVIFFSLLLMFSIQAQLPEYIIEAIDNNEHNKIEFFLRQGGYLEAKDTYGNSMLMLAIKKQQVRTILYLLKSDANVNAENDSGHTPLIYAIKYFPLIIKKLIKFNASIYHKDKLNKTVVMWAIELNQNEFAKKTIKYIQSFYPKSFSIIDHLRHAIIFKNIEIVKFLIKDLQWNINIYMDIQSFIKSYKQRYPNENRYKIIEQLIFLSPKKPLESIEEEKENQYLNTPILINDEDYFN